MFTIPAIHHASTKSDDAPVGGGMHLNAINGSTDFFGCSTLGGGGYFNQPKVYGGLFGVSLSDNHPYRPMDAGSSYQHDCSNTPSPAAIEARSSVDKSPGQPLPASLYQTTSRQRQALECLRDSTRLSPDVPRRHSLDLDNTASNKYNDDLLLSLNDLDLDLSSLNLSDKDTDLAEDVQLDLSKTDPNGQTKRRRYHTTDSAIAERAIKLLAKIKESRKESSHHHRVSKNVERDDVTQKQDTASKTSSRHVLLRHSSEAIHQKDKEVRRPKDKKLVSRSSFD